MARTRWPPGSGNPGLLPRPGRSDRQRRWVPLTWGPADRSFPRTARTASADSQVRPGPRPPTLRPHQGKTGEAGPEALPTSSLPSLYSSHAVLRQANAARIFTSYACPGAQPRGWLSQDGGGYPAGDLGAVAGGGGDADGPAECCQAVVDALQPGAHRRGGRVEAGPVVGDGEHQILAVVAERYPDR